MTFPESFGWLAAVLVLLLNKYLPAYIGKKGENLATKEDIAEITRRVEEVKASLGSRLHVHQVRYQQEFQILLELNEKLVNVRAATLTMRPETDYADSSDPKVKGERLLEYRRLARELYFFAESRQPFFPEDLYLAAKALQDATWKEVVAYKHQNPDDVLKYWENAEANAEIINRLANALTDHIRMRIRQWEDFDSVPNPAEANIPRL